jgi:hypothetical protein
VVQHALALLIFRGGIGARRQQQLHDTAQPTHTRDQERRVALIVRGTLDLQEHRKLLHILFKRSER